MAFEPLLSTRETGVVPDTIHATHFHVPTMNGDFSRT